MKLAMSLPMRCDNFGRSATPAAGYTTHMEELPEETIEAAEDQLVAHDHSQLDDDELLDHLRGRHRLEAPEDLSRSTADGLHDRLHGESDAAS